MKTLKFKLQTVNFLKYFLFSFVLVIFNFKVLSLQPPSVYAQNTVSYPIAGLGYCRDARECSLYCKIPENKAACWSYGTYVLHANVLGTTTMSTQERTAMETKARQYGITFPIVELGNCAGPQECRDYCELTANQTACMNFAKKKGFAKEIDQSNDGIPEEKRQAVMQSARRELGCTSMESCRSTCEQNQDKCEAFAKKYGIAKEATKETQEEQLRKTQMLQVAKQDLGCTSMESCKAICQQDPKRCMNFAQKYGFDKREEIPSQGQSSEGQNMNGIGSSVRPPCANDGSCKQYCKEHPDECPGYQGKPGLTPAGGELRPPTDSAFSSPSGGFVGPSGCKTQEECKQYCQQNPSLCPGFTQSTDYKKYREGQTPLPNKPMPNPNYRIINESTPSSLNRPVTAPIYRVQPVITPTQSGYGDQGTTNGTSVPSTGNVQYQPIPIAPQ